MKELTFSSDVRQAVREEQDRRCGYCGREERGRKRFQVHHCIPKRMIKMFAKDCDSYTLEQFKVHIKSKNNAVLLCPSCHRYWDDVSHRYVYFGFEKPLCIPVKKEK